MNDHINNIEVTDESISIGFVTLSRKIMEHPFFSEKPFSKFHALVWLILNARYSTKPVTRLIGGHMVTWSRGQLPGSLRYLAEAFGWSTKKVNNWLSFLEDQQTVKRVSSETRSATIIQLINYETYQKRKQEKKQDEKHQNKEVNQPQQRDSEGAYNTSGNTEGNTEGNIKETPGKHRGNKTEKKDVKNEEKTVCVSENANSHTVFLRNMNNENYSDWEKVQITIAYDYICKYAPVLLELKKPITPKEALIFTKKYNQKIAKHILEAIGNKVTAENYHSAATTIKSFIKKENDPEIKASIKGCQTLYEMNNSNSSQSKSGLETLEEKGQRLINEVLGTYIPPVQTKELGKVDDT